MFHTLVTCFRLISRNWTLSISRESTVSFRKNFIGRQGYQWSHLTTSRLFLQHTSRLISLGFSKNNFQDLAEFLWTSSRKDFLHCFQWTFAMDGTWNGPLIERCWTSCAVICAPWSSLRSRMAFKDLHIAPCPPSLLS